MTERDQKQAWEKFCQSGKVSDYLASCGILEQKSTFTENKSEGKNSHRRTGDKGTSYR